MRLLVLDGNSILNRAFYGIKLLTTKDGHYTNALVGFLNIFQKLRDQTAPDRIASRSTARRRPSAISGTRPIKPGGRGCRRNSPSSSRSSRNYSA